MDSVPLIGDRSLHKRISHLRSSSGHASEAVKILQSPDSTTCSYHGADLLGSTFPHKQSSMNRAEAEEREFESDRLEVSLLWNSVFHRLAHYQVIADKQNSGNRAGHSPVLSTDV